MLNEKYIELINKEIDGLITIKERGRLHSYLGKNPEAQKFYLELIKTSNLLSKVPEVDPSPNLKYRIMNSLDLNRYSVKQKQSAFKSALSYLFKKPNSRLAYAFVFGVVFGILIYSLFFAELTQNQGLNITDFYGTIGLTEKHSFKTIDDIPINLPEISGYIKVKNFKNIVAIELNLNSSHKFEISLEFNESHLSFKNFVPIDEAKLLFESSENYVRITNEGDIQYILLFIERAKVTSPLYLKLILSGDVRYNHKIVLDQQ